MKCGRIDLIGSILLIGTPSPGLSNVLDLLSKDGLDGATMVVNLELEKNPRSWEALGAQAEILYLREKYFLAINACNKALEVKSLECSGLEHQGQRALQAQKI
jgi:hypothetical protein